MANPLKMEVQIVSTPMSAAIAYAALGWHVLPVRPGSKVPHIDRWQERATSDVHTVRDWWQQWPKGGIGIHCGKSGLAVIDVDPRNGGKETIDAMQVERGLLWDQDCAIARTGGGGWHYVFSAPEGVRLPAKLGPGVDLLSGDRYFIVEPTSHPVTGKAYSWDGPHPINMPPLPPLPEAWWTSDDAPTGTSPDVWEPLADLGPDHLEDTPVNRKRVKSALDALSADVDYPEWRDIVFSVLSTGIADAAELAREWSEGSDRFEDRAFDVLVRSFREERRHGGALIGPGSLFRAAKEAGWTDPKKSERASGKRFEVVPAHAFAEAGPVSWLVQGLLQRDGLGVIFGESGSGKSFLALDLSTAIASGQEWRGLSVEAGRVVYIAAEGAGGFRKRLQATADAQTIPLEGLPLGVIADAPNFLTDDDKAIADAVSAAGGAVLITIDTLAAVTPGGNENSGEDMGEVIARCKRLQSETGAFVMLVHHSGKDASRGARGWSGLRAAVDVEIEVTRNGEDRLARVSKQKDGEDGGQFPFRLRTVDLGTDADGNPVTSCVVEHVDNVPTTEVDRKPKKPKGKNQRIVFEVVEKFGPCSVDDVLTAAAEHMIKDPQVKTDKRRDRAREALEALIAGKFLIQENATIRIYGTVSPEWNAEIGDGEGIL